MKDEFEQLAHKTLSGKDQKEQEIADQKWTSLIRAVTALGQIFYLHGYNLLLKKLDSDEAYLCPVNQSDNPNKKETL